jgi:outer membrane protein assembly factor BamB
VAEPPEPEFSVEWQADLPGSATLVVEGETVYAGRESGVAAFDLATGDREWASDLPGVDLCVRDGRLYCGGGRDGDVAALDAADGSPIWTVETEPGRRTYDVLHVDGLLLVGRHGALEGLDPTTGERRWETNVGGLGDVCPAVVDGALYAGGPGPLELYRPREGWDAVLEAGPEQVAEGRGPVFGRYPAVGPDGVYVGGFGFSEGTALYGFDREARRRWRGPEAFSLTAPAVVDADPTVGVTRTFDVDTQANRLVGVNLEDGTERWGREWVDDLTLPVLAGDHIVVGENGGALRAVDPDTGETAWETTIDASPDVIVPSGERLLVSGVEGTLLSLR